MNGTNIVQIQYKYDQRDEENTRTFDPPDGRQRSSAMASSCNKNAACCASSPKSNRSGYNTNIQKVKQYKNINMQKYEIQIFLISQIHSVWIHTELQNVISVREGVKKKITFLVVFYY